MFPSNLSPSSSQLVQTVTNPEDVNEDATPSHSANRKTGDKNHLFEKSGTGEITKTTTNTLLLFNNQIASSFISQSTRKETPKSVIEQRLCQHVSQ